MSSKFEIPEQVPEAQRISLAVSSSLITHPQENNGIFCITSKKINGTPKDCYNFDSTGKSHLGLGGFGSSDGNFKIPIERLRGPGTSSQVLFVGSEAVILHACLHKDIEDELLNFQWEPITVAPTLQEIIRLMVEYADAPGDMRIQNACRALCREMDVTDQIKSIIYETVPDGPVAKYIKGSNNARQREIPSTYIDDRLDYWLWYQFFSLEKAKQFSL